MEAHPRVCTCTSIGTYTVRSINHCNADKNCNKMWKKPYPVVNHSHCCKTKKRSDLTNLRIHNYHRISWLLSVPGLMVDGVLVHRLLMDCYVILLIYTLSVFERNLIMSLHVHPVNVFPQCFVPDIV